MEVDFGRVHLLEIDFRESQEYEAQNEAPQAKRYIRRSDIEVGMVTAHHLGGRRGGHIMCWGWEKKKWLALGAFRVSEVKNDGQTRFSTRFYVISTTSRIFSCPAVQRCVF